MTGPARRTLPDGSVVEFVYAQWAEPLAGDPPGTFRVAVTYLLDGTVGQGSVLLTDAQVLAGLGREAMTKLHLARARSEDRRCANCGDFIDPIDWCPDCRRTNTPCGRPHKRLRKRADAAFCDATCRHVHRSSYVRDCL